MITDDVGRARNARAEARRAAVFQQSWNRDVMQTHVEWTERRAFSCSPGSYVELSLFVIVRA